jgi:hypothetical protein
VHQRPTTFARFFLRKTVSQLPCLRIAQRWRTHSFSCIARETEQGESWDRRFLLFRGRRGYTNKQSPGFQWRLSRPPSSRTSMQSSEALDPPDQNLFELSRWLVGYWWTERGMRTQLWSNWADKYIADMSEQYWQLESSSNFDSISDNKSGE